MVKNELKKKIPLYFLLTMIFFPMMAYAKTEHGQNQNQNITPEHLVETIVLFEEIYDIDISEGH